MFYGVRPLDYIVRVAHKKEKNREMMDHEIQDVLKDLTSKPEAAEGGDDGAKPAAAAMAPSLLAAHRRTPRSPP